MIKITGGPAVKDIKVFYIDGSGVEIEINDIFCIKFNDILPLQHVRATIEVMAELDIEVNDFNVIKKCIAKKE